MTPQNQSLIRYCDNSIGWAEFRLGAFCREISGITNFPMDCADALLCALLGKLPVAVGFDEEGTDFLLVLDCMNRVYLIENDNKGDSHLHRYTLSCQELATRFLADMERDFEKYVAADDFFDRLPMGMRTWRAQMIDKLRWLEILAEMKQ